MKECTVESDGTVMTMRGDDIAMMRVATNEPISELSQFIWAHRHAHGLKPDATLEILIAVRIPPTEQKL